eukprot:scaffold24010_cov30-Prasinocladus_malaysianus.AAC.2
MAPPWETQQALRALRRTFASLHSLSLGYTFKAQMLKLTAKEKLSGLRRLKRAKYHTAPIGSSFR